MSALTGRGMRGAAPAFCPPDFLRMLRHCGGMRMEPFPAVVPPRSAPELLRKPALTGRGRERGSSEGEGTGGGRGRERETHTQPSS